MYVSPVQPLIGQSVEIVRIAPEHAVNKQGIVFRVALKVFEVE